MPHLAKLASIVAEHSDRRGSQMSSHDDTRRSGGATRGPPGDYEVGYGRPPREHQFRKGEPSRNPKGRPRGAKPAPDLVAALLQDRDGTISCPMNADRASTEARLRKDMYSLGVAEIIHPLGIQYL